MDYLTIEQARARSGLRLVLTRGVPGPWGEAAKAMFRLHDVEFVPVAQIAAEENPELVAWTRHRNAPIALYDDEAPRVRWNELLALAERLGSGPSLLPEDIEDRVLAIGLTNEIAGEDSFSWYGRMLMLLPGYEAKGDAILSRPLYRDYFSVTAARNARQRVQDVLDLLSRRIEAQRARGSDYLVGSTLSVADIYWAYFSQLLEPMPPEHNPMPDSLRLGWGQVAKALGSWDPRLIEQRDRIFERHLWLPLEF